MLCRLNLCTVLQVRKVSRETPQFELQEYPPLVYQLLLLSTHGHRQTILVRQTFCPLLRRGRGSLIAVSVWGQEMILDLFNVLDSTCLSESAVSCLQIPRVGLCSVLS